jgi:D-sedoheptulose 7-phosphate isomerase
MIEAIIRKARESAALKQRFVEENAPAIDACVRALAERFSSGGRLFVMGNGGSACDAQHAAVEFVHPIVEKRRPLPAIALTADSALLTTFRTSSSSSSTCSPVRMTRRWGSPAPDPPPTSTGRFGARVSGAC